MQTLLRIFFVTYACIVQCNGEGSNKATFKDKLYAKFGIKNTLNSLIIFSDKTRTVASLYKFISSKDNHRVNLIDDLSWQVEPGLLQYQNPIEKVNTTIIQLLKKIDHEVPHEFWPRTAITIYGSSDYYSITKENIKGILGQARSYLSQFGFLISDTQVMLMNHLHENFLTWFSVNLLMGRFNSKRKSIATVNLGTKSSSVAFVVDSNSVTDENVYEIKSGIYSFHIYIDSTPMGVEDLKKLLLKSVKSNSNILESDCIYPDVTKNWSYGSMNYTVRSTSSFNDIECTCQNDDIYKKCKNSVSSAIAAFKKPPSMSGHNVYGIAGFYSIAHYGKLITTKNEGILSLYQIEEGAKKICAKENENPFLCMEMVYMYLLFKDIYGLKDSEFITFRHTIKKHEINWGLAAAFLRRFVTVSTK